LFLLAYVYYKVMNAKKAYGFTIIEVMIVLAIAGLIMAIVFFAVPQLQRNSEDQKRKSIANSVGAQIDTYAANTHGIYPFSVPNTFAYPHNSALCQPVPRDGCYSDFISRYINGNIDTTDPSTGQPILTGADYSHGVPIEWPDPPSPSITTTIHAGEIFIVFGAKCDGDSVTGNGIVSPNSNSGQYAIVVGLERDNTDYCVDDS